MKYNDNGTYEDIYVKTFDTLPVGSEVDYDGQTVPSGWEEVTDMSGSNANGSWIKFDDGTMICYRTLSNVDCRSLSQDGSNYFKTINDTYFAVEFYAVPTINVSLINKTNGRKLDFNSMLYVDKSKIGQIVVHNYWNSTDAYVDIHIIAIGRWKA